MRNDPATVAALAAERRRILEIVSQVDGAETRDALALALVDLRSVFQQHTERQVAVGLDAPGARPTDGVEILAAVNAEIVELRAEVDGVWREHRAARDALVRRLRRHEDAVARALEG